MREHYFKERGLYYKANQPVPGRPTLLFIHGLSGSSSAWIPYEKKFKQNYNVVSLDLRGHGKSAKKNRLKEYELAKFSEDIYLLINHLKLSNLVLIGHSFGTLIVQDFLLRYPNLAQATILLSPNFNVNKQLLARALKYALKIFFFMEWLPLSLPQGKHIDYSRYLHTGDWNLGRTFADVRNTSLRVYYYCTRQSYEFNTEQLLPSLQLPALLLHGKKDSIFPATNSLEMVKMMKNAELVMLEEADHILVLNYFTEVSLAMEKFLRRAL